MSRIALIVLDTVRLDYFEKYFDWMPGTTFVNAWSTSHRTPPVHASLFTGRYGSEVGILPDSEVLNCEEKVLAEYLREQGYTTRGYSANPYISQHFDFNRGFDEFRTTWGLDMLSDNLFNWDEFANSNKDQGPSRYFQGVINCIRDDVQTVPSIKRGMEIKLRDWGVPIGPKDSGALEMLSYVKESSFDEDEFLFLNLMEAHEPYHVPKDHQTVSRIDHPTTVELTFRNHNYDPDIIEHMYDDCVKYLSEVYKRIFNILKNKFDLVITCGDHGELFDKNGQWGHFHGVYPELANIPLNIYHGEEGKKQNHSLVSLLDVFPTITDYAGITDIDLTGRSLLKKDLPNEEYLVECRGISSKRIDHIRHNKDAVKRAQKFEESLYGIAVSPTYYGYETLDGFCTEGEATHENPEILLDELVSSLKVAKAKTQKDIPTDVQDRLEDLGYV